MLRVLRLLTGLTILLVLAGCGLPGMDSVGSSGSQSFAAAPSVSERQHQDAQVVGNVVRDDLQLISGYSSVCENDYTGTSCTDAVNVTSGAVQQTLNDLKVLRIPSFMAADVADLTAALTRTANACGPVLADSQQRIAEAYAGNEFDTAVQHVLTAASKVEGDGQS